jgi:hypothetical protein
MPHTNLRALTDGGEFLCENLYRVARLNPRHLAMSLQVCPSAFMRFAVVMCSESSLHWMFAGVGGHHASRNERHAIG